MARSTQKTRGGGPVRLLGERVLRHSGVYLSGTAVEVALTMVRLAVLTRLLPIEDYGQLALLMVYAGFVMMGCRLAGPTGTAVSAFRGGDEDGGDEDDLGEDDQLSKSEQRRLLGTGLVMSLLLTAVLAGVAALAWQPIDAVTADTGDATPVVLATVLGGLQASFFLCSAIARYEKRPGAYVGLQLLQTVLTLGFAILLIEAGFGLNGAIAGTLLGVAVALVPGMFISRHRFTPALDRAHAITVLKRGAPFIAITVSFFLVRNVDLYVLSRYLPETDVALYRVASRLGALSGAGISALVLAWGPLARGPIRGAMTREGSLAKAGAQMLFYYWLFSVWIVVALALLRDMLVKLAASGYQDAALLIPLLGLATVLTTGVVLVHRVGQHKRKRFLLAVTGFSMAALIIGLCVLMIPPLGLYGTPTAVIGAAAIGMALILIPAQRSGNPMPLPWTRIGAAAILGGSWVLVVSLLADLPGAPEGALMLLGALLFPLLLLGARVVGIEEARIILGLFRRIVPGRGNHKTLESGLKQLTGPELELLDRLVRRRESASSMARNLGASQTEVTTRLVALIRRLGGPRKTTPIEYEIGLYLLSTDNVNERDREGHRLSMSAHLGTLELDQLDETIAGIRKLSAGQWTALQPDDALRAEESAGVRPGG